MALILDTNAVSAFADGNRELRLAIGKERNLAAPAVVLGEYLFAIRQSRHRAQYERWLKTHLPLFSLLPIDSATAGSYAEIRLELKAAGRPIPTNDIWIAALARQYDYALLTRDRHFEAVQGLRLMSW
jgi:predicted nucleic acid-binding protein